MMRPFSTLVLFVTIVCCHTLEILVDNAGAPPVTDPTTNVTYRGKLFNHVESFLNIRFGRDTSDDNIFAHPVPFSYPAGTTVDASQPGPACSQVKVPVAGFSIFSNVTDTLEDCLTLTQPIWPKAIPTSSISDSGSYEVRIFGGPRDGQTQLAGYDDELAARCALWNSVDVQAALQV